MTIHFSLLGVGPENRSRAKRLSSFSPFNSFFNRPCAGARKAEMAFLSTSSSSPASTSVVLFTCVAVCVCVILSFIPVFFFFFISRSRLLRAKFSANSCEKSLMSAYMRPESVFSFLFSWFSRQLDVGRGTRCSHLRHLIRFFFYISLAHLRRPSWPSWWDPIFMVELRVRARLQFNCFFSLHLQLAQPPRWRIMHDYGPGTNVHVQLTRWRFFNVSTTRLPPANGEWRTRTERERAKERAEKEAKNATTQTYKLVRLHLATKMCIAHLFLSGRLRSGAMKLSAQHNLIEIIKCKCCPEWTNEPTKWRKKKAREREREEDAKSKKSRWNEKKAYFKWSLLGISHSS